METVKSSTKLIQPILINTGARTKQVSKNAQATIYT